MKRYCVPVVKEITGYVVVEANSPQEAIDKVKQIDLTEDQISYPNCEYHVADEVEYVSEEV